MEDEVVLKIVQSEPEVKVYRKRWIILLIYLTYGSLSTSQWLEYTIIGNLVTKYYNVSVSALSWSAMVFSAMWPVLAFPGSFFIEKMGLRVTARIGALTTALAAIVKIFSVEPDLFYVVMIGQTIAAVSQIFIITLPPKIASTWFRPEEASKVCALGLYAMTFGSALGFIIPPFVVKDHEDVADIGADLKVMCWGWAIFCVSAAIAVFLYFPERPPHAPSLVEHYAREKEIRLTMSTFVKSIRDLAQNLPFLLHVVSYSSNFGIYCAFSTLLNQLVLSYFEGAQEDAGIMGLLMIVMGMIGSVTVGVILDKTRRFKEAAIVIFIFCAVSMGALLYALEMKMMWLCYLTICIFGVFLSGYLPIGFELAIELTYPLPDITVNGILMACSQVISVALTMALSEIATRYGAFYSILAQICVFAFGLFTTTITPNRLKRQEAFNEVVPNRSAQFERLDQNA